MKLGGACTDRPSFNIPKFLFWKSLFNRRTYGRSIFMTDNYDDVLLDHISDPISKMKPGEQTDCEGLIAPEVWKDTPSRERRHAFGIPVSRFVKEGLVPLVFSHINNKRHNVYRKI